MVDVENDSYLSNSKKANESLSQSPVTFFVFWPSSARCFPLTVLKECSGKFAIYLIHSLLNGIDILYPVLHLYSKYDFFNTFGCNVQSVLPILGNLSLISSTL